MVPVYYINICTISITDNIHNRNFGWPRNFGFGRQMDTGEHDSLGCILLLYS